jgi:FtsZ-interacting cell division protein YlmF
MEEETLEARNGLIGRVVDFIRGRHNDEESAIDGFTPRSMSHPRQDYLTRVMIRKEITRFEDAMAAANSLKQGELQVLNLSKCDPVFREKVINFMCGVNFALSGNWEEIGENIIMIVPGTTHLDVAPGSITSPAYSN